MKKINSKSMVKLMFSLMVALLPISYFTMNNWQFTLILLLMIPIPFIQNMAFTWVSRSRQSGDPDHHRYAAWASNGVWLLTQSFIAANIYTPISIMVKEGLDSNSILKILFTFLMYAMATTEGSVFMMKILLGRVKGKLARKLAEKGKRKVGER